jgi:predicted ATPase
MKISVENLGTIKKGEISLDKDLTIFTGENNSGKSYMSYLVYGFLHRLVHGYFKIDLSEKLNEGLSLRDKWIEKEDSISIKITDLYEVYSEHLSEKLQDLLDQILGNPNKSLAKVKVDVDKNNDNYKKVFDFDKITKQGISLYGFIHYNCKIENDTLTLLKSSKIKTENTEELKKELYQKIISNSYFSSDYELIYTYFFPAERTGINMFYNDIIRQKALESEELRKGYNVTTDTITQMKQQGKLIPRSPEAITDYIFFANDFRNFVSHGIITEFADLATELENLLSGNVRMSSFGDLQFQPFGQANILPLHLASSLVKSLSGLVIYLRHLANKSHMVIIDEPEINLHPKTQILIARFLAKMVNRVIKIVVSTHSDYIIKEINNLIMLKNDNPKAKKLAKKLKHSEDELLDYHKVSVYMFENHTITPAEITQTGFDVRAIDEQIIKQGNESRLIYETLYENEN